MDQPRLAFVWYFGKREGTTFPVERWPVSIGRHPKNTIVLEDDPTVSNQHCRVVKENNGIWAYDLKSDNGIYLNGRRVEYRTELIPNASVLGVGRAKLGLVEESRHGRDDDVVAHLLQAGSILIPPTAKFRKAEEVVLVVDVAESTRMAREHGDTPLVKSLWLLARVFERCAYTRGVLFMKCTGDGFLAAFETSNQALSVACEVLTYFARPAQPSRETPPLGLRFAVHRGPVTVNEQGDRFGVAVHLCFRVEGLTGKFTPEPSGLSLPPVNRILVTDEVCEEISSEWQARIVHVGTFTPKGFSDPVRVHAVCWEESPSGKPAL